VVTLVGPEIGQPELVADILLGRCRDSLAALLVSPVAWVAKHVSAKKGKKYEKKNKS
jgi:hypothetical protein